MLFTYYNACGMIESKGSTNPFIFAKLKIKNTLVKQDEQYMQRCIFLAKKGLGYVAPNPMVGAVLVHQHRIIGEGYHQSFGAAHAEVNCLQSVAFADLPLIPFSTLYVNLEPCAHHGKTPPCVDLILRARIKKVVIGTKDIFAQVNGLGIEKLVAAGVEVVQHILEKKVLDLNKRFFTFHHKKRPYIILKWAASSNGKISELNKTTAISNPITNRLVHQWRAAEAAILVGKNTIMKDNPFLTTRKILGKNPIRMVLDSQADLSASHHVFNDNAPTIIWNTKLNKKAENIVWIELAKAHFLAQLLYKSYELGIQSILVEGGTMVLNAFIQQGFWDEIRFIQNQQLFISNGVPMPEWTGVVFYQQKMGMDTISYFKPQ